MLVMVWRPCMDLHVLTKAVMLSFHVCMRQCVQAGGVGGSIITGCGSP